MLCPAPFPEKRAFMEERLNGHIVAFQFTGQVLKIYAFFRKTSLHILDILINYSCHIQVNI